MIVLVKTKFWNLSMILQNIIKKITISIQVFKLYILVALTVGMVRLTPEAKERARSILGIHTNATFATDVDEYETKTLDSM